MLNGNLPVLDAEKVNSEKPSDRSLGILVKAAALCNDAALQTNPENPGKYQAIGDPTEGALIIAAAQLGLLKNELDQRWPRVAELPFTSERKQMTTVHQVAVSPEQTDAPWRDAPYVAFSKGAVDVLCRICRQVWAGNEMMPMTDEITARILAANDQLAQKGQRVLGVAFKPLAELPLENSQASGRRNGFCWAGGHDGSTTRRSERGCGDLSECRYSSGHDYRRPSADSSAYRPGIGHYPGQPGDHRAAVSCHERRGSRRSGRTCVCLSPVSRRSTS